MIGHSLGRMGGQRRRAQSGLAWGRSVTVAGMATKGMVTKGMAAKGMATKGMVTKGTATKGMVTKGMGDKGAAPGLDFRVTAYCVLHNERIQVQ